MTFATWVFSRALPMRAAIWEMAGSIGGGEVLCACTGPLTTRANGRIATFVSDGVPIMVR